MGIVRGRNIGGGKEFCAPPLWRAEWSILEGGAYSERFMASLLTMTLLERVYTLRR